jgi:hypothetical protein
MEQAVKFPSGTPLSEAELLRYNRGEGVWREVSRGPDWVKGEWAQKMYIGDIEGRLASDRESRDAKIGRPQDGSEPGL